MLVQTQTITSNLPSYSENVVKQPSSGLRNHKGKRSKGLSNAASITGNTALRAVQHAASRLARRSCSPPVVGPRAREGVSSRIQQATNGSSGTTKADKPANTVTYRLPTVLPRPKDMPMVTNEALAALDPTLDNVALPYIKDVLQAHRESMLHGLAAIDIQNAQLPPSGLPESLEITVRPPDETKTARLPTHLLCVVNEKTSKGQMYPVHSLVMVAHCARIPAFPPPASPSSDGSLNSIDFPVHAITLPHSESFPPLFDYLYSKNFARFISALIPISSSALPSSSENLNATEKMAKVVEVLSQTYSAGAVLEKLRYVHGLWSNVVKLGIAEEGVWLVMNTAWTILVKALVRTQQQPQETPAQAAASGAV